jgi:hypothetical protein
MPSHRLLLTGFGPGERSEANKQIRALGGKFINANVRLLIILQNHAF